MVIDLTLASLGGTLVSSGTLVGLPRIMTHAYKNLRPRPSVARRACHGSGQVPTPSSCGGGKGGHSAERAWRGRDKLKGPREEGSEKGQGWALGLTGCWAERMRGGSQAGFRHGPGGVDQEDQKGGGVGWGMAETP